MNHIAIKMLMGDRGKYLGIVMGLTFASLIMTQQPAIFLGLMSRSYSFISDVGLPDIWVMDEKVSSSMTSSPCRTPSFTGCAAFPAWSGPCRCTRGF